LSIRGLGRNRILSCNLLALVLGEDASQFGRRLVKRRCSKYLEEAVHIAKTTGLLFITRLVVYIT
jgi:hypothetical protein